MKTMFFALTSMLLLALVPAPAAAQDICDPPATRTACNAYVVPEVREFQWNPGTSVTVTYALCNLEGWCRSESSVTTPPVPPVDGACFAHNPDALTNACVARGDATFGLPPVPPRTVCVVGDQCVTTPGLPPAVTAPGLDGYVEATVLCGLGAPCRVVLP